MTNVLIIIGVIGIVLYGFYIMKKLDHFLRADGIRAGEREESPALQKKEKPVRAYHLYPANSLNKKVQPLP